MVLSSLSALAAATGMNMGTGTRVFMPTGNSTGVVYICIGNGTDKPFPLHTPPPTILPL